MRQVPDGQDACIVRSGGDACHVVHGPGAVVHVGQHQHGNVACQRSVDVLRLDQHQLQAAFLAQRLGNVEVGRKVTAFAQQHLPPRCVLGRDVQRGAQYLVEVDRGAVSGHHLTGRSTNELRNLVAQALRQVNPARAVPTADQALAPFFGHGLGHSGGGGFGQHAQ